MNYTKPEYTCPVLLRSPSQMPRHTIYLDPNSPGIAFRKTRHRNGFFLAKLNILPKGLNTIIEVDSVCFSSFNSFKSCNLFNSLLSGIPLLSWSTL